MAQGDKDNTAAGLQEQKYQPIPPRV